MIKQYTKIAAIALLSTVSLLTHAMEDQKQLISDLKNAFSKSNSPQLMLLQRMFNEQSENAKKNIANDLASDKEVKKEIEEAITYRYLEELTLHNRFDLLQAIGLMGMSANTLMLMLFSYMQCDESDKLNISYAASLTLTINSLCLALQRYKSDESKENLPSVKMRKFWQEILEKAQE